jgi:hypothetical protein
MDGRRDGGTAGQRDSGNCGVILSEVRDLLEWSSG